MAGFFIINLILKIKIVITAKRIFLILILIILIVFSVVVFLVIPQWPIYIVIGLALIFVFYLLFKKDEKITNKPNDPTNPNYNPN